MAKKSTKPIANQQMVEPIFKLNPQMGDAMLYEAAQDRADYYKKAYESEKAKNEQLENQVDSLNKSLKVVHDKYVKIDKKYNDALSKNAQVLRAARD